MRPSDRRVAAELALVYIHGPGPVLIAPLIGEIWNSSKHPQYHTSYLADTDELVSLLHDRNVLRACAAIGNRIV